MRPPNSMAVVVSALFLTWGAPSLAERDPFPEVTPDQRALNAVAGHPDGPAVVLDKRARLQMVDGGRSHLDVWVRLKVLTEAGKRFGQVAVGHSPTVTLERFEGRTVQPDGTVVVLPEAALFREERISGQVTKAAFPAVEVGSILDYRFQLRWDSIYFLEPWYLDDRIPSLRSELAYVEPAGLRVRHHLRDNGRGQVRTHERTTPHGREVTLVGVDLPAVVEEPFGPVFADLALRVMVVPESRLAPDGTVVPLLDRWRSVALAAEQGYDTARRFSRRVRRVAKKHVFGLDDDHARTDALMALVRERVQARDGTVFVGTDASLDRVFDQGRGSYAEVALVLMAMLDAVDIDAQVVWAGDWRGGFPDLRIVNPGWFRKVLVRTEKEGRWLDPGDRRLAPGRLGPTQEGTDAVLVDGPRTRVLVLPNSAAQASARRVKLDLAVDAGGRVKGEGRLVLSGHHAWFYLDRFKATDATQAAWQRWLEQHQEGFAITDVRVEEDRAAQEIEIRWLQLQHEADVLGDEVSLSLSRPLGPLRQRYSLLAESRQTPVLLSFADADEVEARIVWPAGWIPDVVPRAFTHETVVGQGDVSFEVSSDERSGVYRRLLQIDATRVRPPAAYGKLRSLCEAMERSDTQPLVLVLE